MPAVKHRYNFFTQFYPDLLKVIIAILNYIDTAAPLLTLFFFIKPFRQLAKELRYVFWFVCIQFVTNFTAVIMEKVFLATNYSVYVLNVILSFVVLSALFYQLRIGLIKKLVPFVSLAFIVFAVFSTAKGDGIATFNSMLSAIASFVITAYCLIFFYWRLVRDTGSSSLTENSLFWIIIGIFTYYTGSFFIFISYKYLIAKEFNSVSILWRFQNVLLTIFCIYTIYGLTCKDYRKT
jgi:hypothetical protein